jgi:hypothetical protein
MLKEWQSRLGLNAWNIEVHLVSPGSLGSDENGDVTVANIEYDRDTSFATVRVQRALHQETEEGLLHELLHLKLAAWQPPATSFEEEDTVDTLAYALLRSKKSD